MMLNADILNLAAQEDWTPDTLVGLLADFISSKGLDAEALAFLNDRTADAMIDEAGEA